MQNNQENSDIHKVSALDSALKLIMDIYHRFIHFLGVLLIDNAMRDIVHWYDKRHPNLSQKSRQYKNEEAKEFVLQIESLNRSIASLNEDISILQTNDKILSIENESLRENIKRAKEECAKVKNERDAVIERYNTLKEEISELRHRCLPKSEIPSMIYYAQGDASGLSLRKISTTRTEQDLYKIMTIPGDACCALFEPIANANIQEVIFNRNVTLLACEIISIAPAASMIEIKERGKAIYQNNKWIVTSKAKIVLS